MVDGRGCQVAAEMLSDAALTHAPGDVHPGLLCHLGEVVVLP